MELEKMFKIVVEMVDSNQLKIFRNGKVDNDKTDN